METSHLTFGLRHLGIHYDRILFVSSRTEEGNSIRFILVIVIVIVIVIYIFISVQQLYH